jgi:hypothetical protein
MMRREVQATDQPHQMDVANEDRWPLRNKEAVGYYRLLRRDSILGQTWLGWA